MAWQIQWLSRHNKVKTGDLAWLLRCGGWCCKDSKLDTRVNGIPLCVSPRRETVCAEFLHEFKTPCSAHFIKLPLCLSGLLFFSLLKQIRFHMNNKEQKDWAMVLKQWSNIIFILSCIHVTRIVYPTFCKLMPLHCNKRIEKICILFWILCHHFVAYIHIISNFVQIQWYACYVHP